MMDTLAPAPNGIVPTAVLERLAIGDPRWRAFVEDRAESAIFHHPVWASLLAECYGYPVRALALTDAEGQIRAGMPVLDVSGPLTGRRLVSLPFTDYCPVLADDADQPRLAEALDRLRTGRRLDAVEVRAGLPRAEHVHTAPAAVRHTLDLSGGTEAVERGFSKMHKRNIRKAERAEVRVRAGTSRERMEAFYRLHLLTRRRLGVPVQPRKFFRLLSARLIERGLGTVLVAELRGAPIAAAVFLEWNGTMVYKYGASDARAWEHRPNNLLFREAIRLGCARGHDTLDWGRTDLGDEGLREFKRGWGAVEEPVLYTTIADAPPRPSSGRVTRAMGAVIRRSSPAVCRAIGEVFYRYAA